MLTKLYWENRKKDKASTRRCGWTSDHKAKFHWFEYILTLRLAYNKNYMNYIDSLFERKLKVYWKYISKLNKEI